MAKPLLCKIGIHIGEAFAITPINCSTGQGPLDMSFHYTQAKICKHCGQHLLYDQGIISAGWFGVTKEEFELVMQYSKSRWKPSPLISQLNNTDQINADKKKGSHDKH